MTSSSTFRSRSCKIKEPNLKENSLQSKPENDLESIETKSSCEPSSTRISWKTSKIFSRTLSSIEVIRAMKSNKQNHQHHSQSNQHISVSPTKPSVIVTATGDSAISTSILPASKASSRHEVTSHSLIIKDHPDGAILSENNETTSGVVRTRSGNSKAASEWKVLKNKLSSLRKRSTGSSSGPRGDGEESLSASTSPGPGDGEGEGRRLSSNSRTGSARTSRSGSQDEGIVCKREDLINLLTEATKVASSTTSITANSPPPPPSSTPTSMTTTTSIIKPSIMKSDQQNIDTSPTSIGPRKVILKTSSVYNSVVQVTGAENIDTTRKLMKKSALKKNPAADSNNNYNNNSNNNNATHNNCNNSRPNSSTGGSVDSQGSVEFIETRIVVPSKPSLKFDLPHEKETRSRQTKAIQFKEADNSPAAMTTTASSSSSILTSPSSSTAATTLTKTCDSQNTIGSDNELTGKSDKKILIEADNQDSESSPSVAAVKWDESNVVDAMILGDAIQAFLRGMGGSSEKTEKPPEKRVLFKKLS